MIKKEINSHHSLLKTDLYPSSALSRGGNKALLGIGGNIGDVVRRFSHLLYYFKRSCFLHVIESSPILKNPAFGYTKQADFYNALLLVETSLSPKLLLRYLLRVEKRFGRKRLFKDAPRTLDIDIIFYEKIKMQTRFLTLPHPQWNVRTSVLTPLSYMKKAL